MKYKKVVLTYNELVEHIRKNGITKARVNEPLFLPGDNIYSAGTLFYFGVYNNALSTHNKHTDNLNRKVFPRKLPSSYETLIFGRKTFTLFVPATSKDNKVIIWDEASMFKQNNNEIKWLYKILINSHYGALRTSHGISKSSLASQTYNLFKELYSKGYGDTQTMNTRIELKDIKPENLKAGIKTVEEQIANDEKEFAARKYREYIDSRDSIDRDEKRYIEDIKTRREELEEQYTIFIKRKEK